MRDVSAAIVNALAKREVVARDFLWLTARHLSEGGVPLSIGFWSDVGTVSVPVVEALTQLTVTRDYIGAGTLIAVDDVPLTADVSVREIGIEVSQIDANVANVVRGYDCKAAPMQLHRGLFDPANRNLVGPAYVRFFGFVDTLEIVTPQEGGEGKIALRCVSHSVELTRANSETRSDASQRARDSGDGFYRYTGVTADWEIFWGKDKGKLVKNKRRRGQ